MRRKMYEELTFGDLTTAHRTTNDGDVAALNDAAIRHEDDGTNGPELHVENIGEGPLNHVYVDLLKGELSQRKESRGNPEYHYDEANIDVSDCEMTITIDRGFETVVIVVECDGEVTDETGVDLGELGIGL